MKKISYIAVLLLLPVASLLAQMEELPKIELRSLEGEIVYANDLGSSGNPLVLVFWNESSYTSISQMSEINEVYEEYKEREDVDLVSVYVDNIGRANNIRPIVNGNAWSIDVYIDKNAQFMRSMNIPSLPYTVVFDDDMNLMTRYSGHCQCAMNVIYEDLTAMISLQESDSQPAR